MTDFENQSLQSKKLILLFCIKKRALNFMVLNRKNIGFFLTLILMPGILFILTTISIEMYRSLKYSTIYNSILRMFDIFGNSNALAWVATISLMFVFVYFVPISVIFIILFFLRKVKLNHIAITILVSNIILIPWYYGIVYSESHHLKYGFIYIIETIFASIFIIPYFEKRLFENLSKNSII